MVPTGTNNSGSGCLLQCPSRGLSLSHFCGATVGTGTLTSCLAKAGCVPSGDSPLGLGLPEGLVGGALLRV